jgi:uncharacterized protein
MQHLLEDHLEQLTLEVTTRCNQRCTYCSFTADAHGHRAHGNEVVSDDILSASIEYLQSHSTHSEQPALGLYGGEPLLAQRSVELALDLLHKRGMEVLVSITTNGTASLRRVPEYARDHWVSLLVSLDGPAPEHNRFRRSEAGRGTHATVMRNLAELAELDPEYYRRNVGVNCVITPATDLHATREFFEADGLMQDVRLQVSGMAGHDDVAPIPRHPARSVQIFELEREYLAARIAGEAPSAFLRALFDGAYVRFFKRNIYAGFEEYLPPGGMCLPGQRKIFVDCSGAFHACERVPRQWPLGSITDGLSCERVQKLMDLVVRRCEGPCTSCWAVRLCSPCLAGLDTRQGGGGAPMGPQCEASRRSCADLLKNVVLALEKNKAAFDWVSDITVT